MQNFFSFNLCYFVLHDLLQIKLLPIMKYIEGILKEDVDIRD